MSDDPTLSRAERNRLQLRAEIVQAAFDEFAVQGYHQTGIADIAKRAGIGHGTFYRHFEGKREILEQVINDVLARLMATVTQDDVPTAATTLEEYRGQISRITQRLAAIFVENPAVARLVLFEATAIDPEITQRLLNLLDWGGQVTAAYLDNGVQRGFLRADLDTKSTGRAVIGMTLMGVLSFLNTPEDREGQKHYGEAVQRLLIDGAVAAA